MAKAAKRESRNPTFFRWMCGPRLFSESPPSISLNSKCRCWNALIKSQSFVESHLHHWTSRPISGLLAATEYWYDFFKNEIFYFSFDLNREGGMAKGLNLKIQDFASLQGCVQPKEVQLLASGDGFVVLRLDSTRFLGLKSLLLLCIGVATSSICAEAVKGSRWGIAGCACVSDVVDRWEPQYQRGSVLACSLS
ncbi:uncharacterized protein LOC116192838 [Punica granatum]|uniref:Uncharacterized protein LOC116192838 n=1 Tax=Punica granatum TaxID=22663 RepID=A0A6P8C1I7_PUNGR|nr:uncharacterized protein LOC116192838 [Punica granatum]